MNEIIPLKKQEIEKKIKEGKRFLYLDENYVIVAMDYKTYMKEFPEDKRYFDELIRGDLKN